MANVKVSKKQVSSNRDTEKTVESRSLMEVPKLYSRFEKTGFVTTEPSVVDRLFAEKIYATLKRGEYIEYTYTPEDTDRIKAVLWMK